jgi:hypothetical protein
MPKKGYKQSKLDPKTVVKLWQDTEEQVRLAHPHESKKNRDKITERYVKEHIINKQRRGIKSPDPGEKQIADWYKNELFRLRLEIPDTPLKIREEMAANIVSNKIKRFRSTIKLDFFFEGMDQTNEQ